MRRFSSAAAVVLLALWGCSSKSDRGGGTGGQGGTSAGSSGTNATGASGGSISAGGTGGSTGGTGGTSGSATGGSANTSSGGTGNAGSGGASATGGDGNATNGGSINAGSGGKGGASGTGGTSGTGGNATGGVGAGGSATGGNSGSAGEAGQSSGGCTPNDEFAGSELDPCWQLLNGTVQDPLIELNEAGGALHLSANGSQNGVWYQGATKSLVFQIVTSTAWKVTTTAHPRKVTDASSLPTKDLHVGGLMVRNPASMGGNTENYLFIMLGHSENNNGMVHQGVEFKSTFNGCSDWLEPDWGTAHDGPDADLRICRLGSEFRNYKRVPGDATWTLADAPSGNCSGNVVSGGVLTRADMPSTVQVGLGLNFNAPSDLDVAFDYIHFAELPAGATADDCTTD